MYLVLLFLLLALISSMLVCVSIINRSHIKNRGRVVQLILMATFTVSCYMFFILSPSEYVDLATFASGLYFLATDWLVVFLMLFASDYTHMRPISRVPRRVIGFLTGVDSLSFIVNTYTHHMFEVERKLAEDSVTQYWDVQLKDLYMVHRVFVHCLVIYILFIFAYRLIKVPTIYKGKYSTILVQTAAVVGVNILCSVINAKFDYSVVLYATLAMSICYFVLYASPRGLLRRIHSTIVKDSVNGLFAYDNAGKCIGVNRVAEEMFAGEAEITKIAELYLAEWREEYQGNEENIIGAERTMTKNGQKVYLYVTYQKFLDDKGRVLGYCFLFENRTEMVRKYTEEQYRATHDMLTGLWNRNAFEEEAKKILAEATEPYCVVCSNIKDFKMVNELYGTDAGDRLLAAQANMIRRQEKGRSASARIFADRFCTLMPRSHFNEKEFLDNMSETLELGLSSSFKLHFYLGVYDITDVNEPVWTMYDKAMMAIDSVMGNYDQYICYYKEELLQNILEEKEVLGVFDRALKERQFAMFLQPQIANNGSLVGAEALVRWMHPEKGMIRPEVFIPTLEKAGLIHKLDLYMWENAARKLEEWKKRGKGDLSISVNISTKDFFFLDVREIFHDLANKYDFDIKKLKLEITESALMDNVREILNTLDELQSQGYDIEIDDFGSGYSSLGLLKDINADILKIDMIFLQETKNEEKSSTILKNIISMSKELGMPVITEGVETKKQADFLMQAGCDMFQGFYFAKPMSVESFEKEYF